MYKSFKEMPIWQEAMEIAEEIFRLTFRSEGALLPKKVAEIVGTTPRGTSVNLNRFQKFPFPKITIWGISNSFPPLRGKVRIGGLKYQIYFTDKISQSLRSFEMTFIED